MKNYAAADRISAVACGANADDYNWTEVLMKNVGRRMNGLSLHYYTLPTGNWGNKGSATDFDENRMVLDAPPLRWRWKTLIPSIQRHHGQIRPARSASA